MTLSRWMALLIFLVINDKAFAVRTFLESIRFDKPFLSREKAFDLIAEFAKKDKSYLSLGETHNDKENVGGINFQMAVHYLNNTRSQNAILCSEFLSFLDTFYGKKLTSLTPTFILNQNNSALLDFSICYKEMEPHTHTIFLSGIFHQFPFVANFGPAFKRNVVTIGRKGTIYQQINRKHALFFAQVELSFLESVATQDIISLKIKNPYSFRNRVEELLRRIDFIRERMEPIPYGETQEQRMGIRGIFLSKDNLLPPQNNDIYKHAYFLVTESSYRTRDSSLSFLREIIKLDDQTLAFFLNTVSQKDIDILITAVFPSITTSVSGYGYGYGMYNINIPEEKDIQFVELYTKNSGGPLFIAGPKSELTCYEKENSHLKCHDFLSSNTTYRDAQTTSAHDDNFLIP